MNFRDGFDSVFALTCSSAGGVEGWGKWRGGEGRGGSEGLPRADLLAPRVAPLHATPSGVFTFFGL